MPYIAPDGTIHENRPWTVSRVTDYFWGILNFVYAFFTTLIKPGGGNGQGRGQGGGGGSGSGGPGGPGGPRRRMGGVTTIQDCSMPGGG